MPVIQPQKTADAHITIPAPPPAMLGTALAFLFTVVSAWLSQGTMAHGDGGAARLALLPVTPFALALVLVAGAAMLALIRVGASRLPLLLLALTFLPWLPVPVPPVFLLWSGPLLLAVWASWELGRSAAALEMRRP